MSYRNYHLLNFKLNVTRMSYGHNPVRGPKGNEEELDWTFVGYGLRDLKLCGTYQDGESWFGVCSRCKGEGVLNPQVQNFAIVDKYDRSAGFRCFACDVAGVSQGRFRLPVPAVYKRYLGLVVDKLISGEDGGVSLLKHYAQSEHTYLSERIAQGDDEFCCDYEREIVGVWAWVLRRFDVMEKNGSFYPSPDGLKNVEPVVVPCPELVGFKKILSSLDPTAYINAIVAQIKA